MAEGQFWRCPNIQFIIIAYSQVNGSGAEANRAGLSAEQRSQMDGVDTTSSTPPMSADGNAAHARVAESRTRRVGKTTRFEAEIANMSRQVAWLPAILAVFIMVLSHHHYARGTAPLLSHRGLSCATGSALLSVPRPQIFIAAVQRRAPSPGTASGRLHSQFLTNWPILNNRLPAVACTDCRCSGRLPRWAQRLGY